jgi:hypothetical protein
MQIGIQDNYVPGIHLMCKHFWKEPIHSICVHQAHLFV